MIPAVPFGERPQVRSAACEVLSWIKKIIATKKAERSEPVAAVKRASNLLVMQCESATEKKRVRESRKSSPCHARARGSTGRDAVSATHSAARE